MRPFWKYSIWAAFCFMIGFSYEYHLPKFETWLIVKIEQFSRDHLPIRILPHDIRIQFFPPGLRIEGIRAIPKAELSRTLAPLRIQSVNLQIRPLSLLLGDYRIFRIEIENPEITLLTVAQKSKPAEQPYDLLLKEILNQPLHSFAVTSGTIQVRSPQAEILIRSEDTNFSLENRKDRALFNLDFKKILVKRAERDSQPAEVTLRGTGSLRDNELLLKNLKITHGPSFVLVSGASGGQPLKGIFERIQAKAQTHIETQEVLATLRAVRKDLTLPSITGDIDTNISFVQKTDGSQLISTELSTTDIHVQQFEIGDVTGRVDYDLKSVTASSLNISNSAGKVALQDFSFGLDEENAFKGTLVPDNLELQKLLMALGLKEIPLHLSIYGKLPCAGVLHPEFKMSCDGEVNGRDFWVKNSSARTIVALDDFRIQGDVLVNTKGVYPKGKITIGSSNGSAEGSVEYHSGFQFAYKAETLDVKDIRTLADLRLEGKAKLDGSVSGNSDTAKFGMNIKTQDFWFEDFGVGNAQTKFDFLKGVLSFKDIEGLFNTTRYYADISVDLNNSTIRADGKLGFAEARDLQSAFARKAPLPFETFGNLTGRLSARGPLKFNELSYELEASAFRGTVGQEAFDELRFHVNSKNGNVRATDILLKKGLGVATLTGTGSPNGQIDTLIKARGFRLEDLSLFNQNESAITGQINFDMTMKGHVLSPETGIKGDITQTTIAREPVEDSKFQLKLTRSAFSGQTYFLNEKVWLDFEIPFDTSYPFKLKGRSNQWNFSPLFGLLTNESATQEFDTELTSEVDLSSSTGGFWAADGKISVSKLRIRRGNLELHNPQTSVANFEKGRMYLRDFLLQGDNTFLKAEANGSRKDDLGISLNGKIEMSLLSFLTPFFSDIRGILSTAIQLDGTADEPKLIGSAFVDKGFIKLKELIHPFENIRADLLFNQQRIVVNSIQAVFAGGNAMADGSLEVHGLRQIPVDLKGHFDKVNLLVPKDFNTRGSGEFKVTGNWFPYLLSGTYRASSGIISREIGEETDSRLVKRSALLPSSFQQQSFSALRFDLTAAFPSGVFVRNSLTDTEVRGSLRIQGTPEDPSILGEVTAPPGGKIMFRDVPFEISSATFRFTDPLKINPTMYAAASSRLRDYDINFLLQGNRENYRINLRSTPPLPESDIISLLALGYTPQQLEKVTSDQQIDQQSYEIGGALLSNNPLGNEIKSKYGVNVRFGSSVDDTTQTVAPKVTVSKQWNQKFNTSASRTVGNVVKQDVKAEYQLNRNVSVIGSWEGKEFSEEQKTTEQTNKSSDVLGLDLQYRMEFK